MDRYYFKFFLLIILLTSYSGSLKALSWEEALHNALSHNEDIFIGKERVKKAISSHKKAKAGYYPTLTGSSGLTRSETEKTSSTTSSYGLTLGLDLYSGFKTTTGIDQTQIKKEQSKIGLSQTKLTLLETLRESFADALYTQKFVKLSKRILKRKRDNYDFFRLRYPSGLEPKWALTKAKIEWKEARWELKQAFINKKLALKTLYVHIGLEYPKDEKIHLLGNFKLPPLSDFKILKQMTLGNHLDILYQNKEILWKEKAIALKKADYHPSVSLSSSYTISKTSLQSESKTWSSSVSLSWPLFSGFKTVHDVSEARSDLIIARFERRKKKRILLQNLKRAYQKHIEAREKTTFTLKSFKSSRERAMVIQQEYSAGLKTYLDWESSQNSWTQMERRHLEALKNTWITLAKLEKAKGTLKKGSPK